MQAASTSTAGPLWRVDPSSGRVRPWMPSPSASASVSASASAASALVPASAPWTYEDAARPRGPKAVQPATTRPQRPRKPRASASASASASTPASTAASSTERGRKFRKRLQERELQARAEIELLRQQIVRMQALKRQQRARPLMLPGSTAEMRVAAGLGASVDGGSALRFVREYFSLFRHGVVSSQPPGGEIVLDSSRQENFLSAWTVPDVKFDEFVGMRPMIDQWRRYSSVHSFIKLDPVSMEVQTTSDGRPTVVAKGVLHIRYARRTIESVFPHLKTVAPDLVERLVGRLVHMHYTSHYFFDEHGKLVSQQIVPDFVNALKEVLGSLDDVARVLDSSLLHEHVLGEVDYDRFEEEVESPQCDHQQQPPPQYEQQQQQQYEQQEYLQQHYQEQQQYFQQQQQHYEHQSQFQPPLQQENLRELVGRCDQSPTTSAGMGLSFLLS